MGHISWFFLVYFDFSSGEVIIKLRNRGEEAYKQNIYGNSITVERKLRADGGSSYNIKNARGNARLLLVLCVTSVVRKIHNRRLSGHRQAAMH